jgi:hypothetical protein
VTVIPLEITVSLKQYFLLGMVFTRWIAAKRGAQKGVEFLNDRDLHVTDRAEAILTLG